jgi:hypothetical protein
MLWRGSSETADELSHVVQFCEGEAPLLANVIAYLSEGLDRGGCVLVIASPERGAALAGALQESRTDLDRAVHERRILFADSGETLDRFMLDGMPDWRRFERTISALIQQLQTPSGCGIRAYGDMVAALWQRGQRTAAARLEQYWNRILRKKAIQLFCSYPMDVLSSDFHARNVDPLMAEHSHVLSGAGDHLAGAIECAMKEVLKSQAAEHLRRFHATLLPAWPTLAEAEAIILWLRANLPEQAEEILTHARISLPETEPSESFEPVSAEKSEAVLS